ncbi:MAG: acetoacetate--CoA ligase [Proteobacteria bacterium]|nr:MAG: acetoacetate--CoA ligase [Pseudomonadota bacterium]
MQSSKPLWIPGETRKELSQMTQFARFLEEKTGLSFADFPALHHWSVSRVDQFWGFAAEFLGIRWENFPDSSVTLPPEGKMLGARWFPGGTLSYAANMLSDLNDKTIKIISLIEGCDEPVQWTGGDLYRAVARCAKELLKLGIKPGDRVAGVLPNTAEAIIAMLGANAIGAVWSSCSPDFGQEGILDRFGQIEPKVLFVTTSYLYNGKTIDCRPTIAAIMAKLPTVLKTVAIDPIHSRIAVPGTISWTDFLAAGTGAEDNFKPLATPFEHPLYILFSSGTTGKPKCIVHSVGGSLLQHKKELMLHSGISEGSRLLYFTTCGWMMWNWMASALSTGASIVLFEGSITRDHCNVLWAALDEHRVSCFGTSAKFIATSIKEGVEPARDFDLSALETLLSTGSPLLPEHFSWVYGRVKEDLHLASISGGTDIVSCFMLGNPWSPVYSGEIQGPGLGMAVECWDEAGQSLRNEKGELVCVKPFPAMPIGFWQDDAKRSKYRDSYFTYFPEKEVWRHGDFIEINDHLGITVFGRSDATLNPGGVRIGTAEIYRQVEQSPSVLDSLAVSFERSGDAEMLLFVKLKEGVRMSPELDKEIRTSLRSNLSPRHVPALIFPVSDIPYTRSGKKLELAVTRILQKMPIDNQTAIANPECLAEYQMIAEDILKV